MSKIWGISSPTNRGPKNYLFGPNSQLNGNLNGYIIGIQHDTDNPSSALTTTSGLNIAPICHELWSTDDLNPTCIFTHPLNSAFCFTARLRRQRSANRTQPNFAKRRMLNRANNLLYNSWGDPPRKKWGPRNSYVCSVFTTSTLNGEYLLNET